MGTRHQPEGAQIRDGPFAVRVWKSNGSPSAPVGLRATDVIRGADGHRQAIYACRWPRLSSLAQTLIGGEQ